MQRNLGMPFYFSDTVNVDAFGRLRVSNPRSIFDCTFQFDAQPEIWVSKVTGGATVSHNANMAAVKLSTTTASGDRAIFQTRRTFHYQPGKSQRVILTGNFDSLQTNNVKRFGQFNANNGWFFKTDGSTYSVGIRSKVSGSVVDTEATQANWNFDKLDGNGPSGVTLDPLKQQLWWVDYTWLSTGRVRFGFYIGGRFLKVHEFNHANLINVPYSQTATLPLRAEVENTGTTSAATNFNLTCASLDSEGDYNPEGSLHSGGNGTTAKTLGATRLPLLSLRKQAAFVDVPAQLVSVNPFIPTADDILFDISVNPTLTGATWTQLLGISQLDTGATAITGGRIIHSFYMSAQANGMSSAGVDTDVIRSLDAWLGADVDGVSDIITLSATSLTAAAQGYATMTWKELD